MLLVLLRAFSRSSPAFASMADLPRWVDRWDVDSNAMLSAFIAYHTEVSAMLEEKHGLESAFPGGALEGYCRLIWECFSKSSVCYHLLLR